MNKSVFSGLRFGEDDENRLKNRTPQGKLPAQLVAATIHPPQPLPWRETSSTMRRGARVAESGSLENCCPGNGTVGSIPTLSANFQGVAPPHPCQGAPVPPQVSPEV